MTPEQEYNRDRAIEAVNALDHLSRAWHHLLSSRELDMIALVAMALGRATAEDAL